jgi:hypothetical protein
MIRPFINGRPGDNGVTIDFPVIPTPGKQKYQSKKQK